MLSDIEVNTLTIPSGAVEVCHRAADLIEEHGWDAATEICEATGHVGLIGALRLAVRPDYRLWSTVWTSNIDAYDEALILLNRVLGESPRLWSMGRSQDEVVALLRGVGK